MVQRDRDAVTHILWSAETPIILDRVKLDLADLFGGPSLSLRCEVSREWGRGIIAKCSGSTGISHETFLFELLTLTEKGIVSLTTSLPFLDYTKVSIPILEMVTT